MQKTAFNHEISMSELNYLRDQGLSNKEIADKVGCSTATVSKYLPSQRKARARLSDEDRNDILELYHSGKKVKEIAESYGCTLPTIYNLLKAEGIQVRCKKKTEKKQKTVTLKTQQQEPDTSAVDVEDGYIHAYEGRLGKYVIDTKDHILLCQPKIGEFDKETVSAYIRDLMIVWRKM